MKNAFKIVLGLALIAAGVLWVLSALGVLTINFSTEGWWALFIIVPCLFGLINDRDKIGSLVGLGWGVLLLLAARDVISWNIMWQIGVALMIVGLGVRLLFCKGSCHNGECDIVTISRDGKEIRSVKSSFGKQSLSFAGEKFEGADVESSFGALILNLNGADIAADAFINLNVGFSGVTIIVPENLGVKLAVNSGFGGVQDNRFHKAENATKTLLITGKVGFGGVEIRN